MPIELTPAEEAFFQSGGELPPELQEQMTPAPAALDPTPAATPAAPEPALEQQQEAPAPAAEPSMLERMLAEERDRRAALESQLAEINSKLEAVTRPAPQVVEEPNEFEDPLGAMLHKLNKVTANVDQLNAHQQLALQRQQLAEFTQGLTEQKNAFKVTAPDFDDAYKHIRNVRTEDLRAAGCPEKDIKQVLLQDEFQLAQAAVSRGKNAAEEMYNMAKRYGYTPKAPDKPAPAEAPTAAAALVNQRIDQLKAGQTAAQQPPARAAAPETALTFAGLKETSNETLNNLVQDDTMWEKIVGGRSGSDIF